MHSFEQCEFHCRRFCDDSLWVAIFGMQVQLMMDSGRCMFEKKCWIRMRTNFKDLSWCQITYALVERIFVVFFKYFIVFFNHWRCSLCWFALFCLHAIQIIGGGGVPPPPICNKVVYVLWGEGGGILERCPSVRPPCLVQKISSEPLNFL